MRIAGPLLLLPLLIGSLAGRPGLRAEEPVAEFLAGLQARGLHDMALAYLDQMADSPLAPPDFKRQWLYEKSLVLVAASRNQHDADERQRQLDLARNTLQQFIDEHSEHPRHNAAQIQLGMLTVEQARIAARLAEANQTPERLQDAQSLCRQAIELLDKQNQTITAQLDELPKVLDGRDREQAKMIERRKQLRADVLQTEQLAAATREELAGLLPPASEEQKQLYLEAAARYDQIYKDYRLRIAGRTARLYQARCLLRLGRNREALAYLSELLELPPDSEPARMLKAKAMAMAMDSWLLPEEDKYLEVIRRGNRWFQETATARHREPDSVAIRYQLARGLKRQADAIDASEQADAETRRTRQQAWQAARDHLRQVAAETGPYQSPARQLLDEMGVAQADGGAPENFAAAQALGKKSLDQVTRLHTQLAALPPSGQAPPGQAPPGQAADGQAADDQRPDLQAQLDQAQDDTIRYFRLALQLADDRVAESQIGIVQYFLCYAYYLQQDYYRAAVLGEFVAQHHATSPGAGQCAKIAIASYLQLIDAASSQTEAVQPESAPGSARGTNVGSPPDALLDRLVALGQYCVERWPGQAITEESLISLLPAVLNAGRFAQAADFVDRLPAEHTALGELQLLTGQGLWGEFREQEYRRAEAAVGGGDASAVSAAPLDPLNIDRARRLLLAGYEWLPQDQPTSQSHAISLLALAQIHLHDGQPAQAIEILEAADVGLLLVADSAESGSANPLLAEEIYRTALRAYVASFADAGPEQADKAQQTMVKMRQAAAQNPAGHQRMLGVFVSLAHDVSQQLQAAPPDQHGRLIDLYESFLLALSETADDSTTVHWVATTFANLADEFAASGQPPAVTERFYRNAEQAFRTILDQTGTPQPLVTQVKVQLADGLTKQQRFADAVQLYRELLATDPNAINLQVAAADLLTQWGQAEPQRLQQAISGDGGDQGVIWGWAKIAATAIRHEPFRDVFYQARYQIARCLLGQSQTASGAKRSQKLADAQRSLTSTTTLYPDLGDWQQRYDDLLTQIQAAQ